MQTELNNETTPSQNQLSPTVQALNRFFQSRRKSSQYTDLDRLKYDLERAGVPFSAEDYSGYFKNLEAKGIGQIILGRGKNSTRFRWIYSILAYAKAINDLSTLTTEEVNKPGSKRSPGRPKGTKDAYQRVRKSKGRYKTSRKGKASFFDEVKPQAKAAPVSGLKIEPKLFMVTLPNGMSFELTKEEIRVIQQLSA